MFIGIVYRGRRYGRIAGTRSALAPLDRASISILTRLNVIEHQQIHAGLDHCQLTLFFLFILFQIFSQTLQKMS
ncbi:hypothetical protein BDW42DRAFT_55330 [Aspergillus taichungensis]|uniref:Uncharacterized protein n=1 Tax=Aspergillus taichungensis TaxID=482145 RepID=A0A2J5I9K5_9EURO|nr:hypothetical protein BDW42DRAFT_55330 [Aspergillus taichungensis]